MMKLPSQFDTTIDNTAPEDTAMPFPYPKIISTATKFDINDHFSTHPQLRKMNDLSHASTTILDFLTLLEVEQQTKEKSHLFNAAIWQDLNQLNLDLNEIAKPNKIALAILDWCEKYPEIDQLLKSKNWSKLRCDMVGEDDIDIPPPDLDGEAEIIRNRDRIQKIIQENQQPPNQDSPNNPEQD